MGKKLLENVKNVKGNYEGGFKEIIDIKVVDEALKSNEFIIGNKEVSIKFDMVNLRDRIDHIGYKLTRNDSEYNRDMGKIEIIQKLLMKELKDNERALELLEIYDECINANEATSQELWYKQGVADSEYLENGLIWTK